MIFFVTRYHEWKSLVNRFTSEKNHWFLISLLIPRMFFSKQELWNHHNWSVTSCKCEVLVMWWHSHPLFSHMQIQAQLIFTIKSSWSRDMILIFINKKGTTETSSFKSWYEIFYWWDIRFIFINRKGTTEAYSNFNMRCVHVMVW